MKVRLLQFIKSKWRDNDVNNNRRIVISIILIFVGALLAFYIKPKVLKIIIKFLFVAKPGHFVRKKHETKLRFKYKLYLWNVTNPEEIIAGTEKPKLQEVGPYVFHEFKQKVNSEDNKTEDTVSFNFWSSYIFSPELSAPLTGNEVVTLLNTVITIVLIMPQKTGMVKIQSESPHLLDILIEAMDIIFKKPSSIFLTMTAMQFIDTGIDIDCNHTEISARMVCAEMRRSNLLKFMNDKKTLMRFRWFDSLKNDSIQARYTIMRGSKNVRDVGRVTAINDRPLKVYDREPKCNIINGTDSMYLPPFQRKNDVLWVFSDAACKSFPLRFKYKKRLFGIKTTYKCVHFADPLMNPDCECNEYTGCAAAGTLDLYQCLKLFISISSPHYYLAESSIRDTIDGMNPSANLHETGCYLDLQTGVPLIANQRVQVNVLIKRIPEYPIFSTLADENIWLPLLWYDESFDIEKADLAKVFASRNLLPLVVWVGYVLMAMGIFGCTMTTAFILHRYYRDHVMIKPAGQPQISSNQSDTR